MHVCAYIRVHNVIQTTRARFSAPALGLLLHFLSDRRKFIIVMYARWAQCRVGPAVALLPSISWHLGSNGAEERRKDRREGEREERSRGTSLLGKREDMHLSTILVPLFRRAPYGISRPVGFAANDDGDGGQGGRKGGKVRAGRRKRSRQDVGSCLPAGG